MSLLTKQERDAIEEANKYEGADGWEWDLDMVITAIEAAVIRKLVTVSVEWPESASSSHEVYLREQIEPMLAAARVQENERIANWYYNGGHRLSVFDVAPAIRALIGGKDD